MINWTALGAIGAIGGVAVAVIVWLWNGSKGWTKIENCATETKKELGLFKKESSETFDSHSKRIDEVQHMALVNQNEISLIKARHEALGRNIDKLYETTAANTTTLSVLTTLGKSNAHSIKTFIELQKEKDNIQSNQIAELRTVLDGAKELLARIDERTKGN